MRAWENAHQYRPQGTPLAWLLTIARNLALMKLAGAGQDPGHGSGGLGTAGSGEPDGDGGGPAGAGRRLTALADDERQIVLLHAVTGWKHREMQACWSCPCPRCCPSTAARS